MVIRPRARVVLISAVGARQNGIKTEAPWSSSRIPMAVSPGSNPDQLETRIKINRVPTIGKKRLALAWPAILSTTPKRASIIDSTNDWRRLGAPFSLIVLEKR